MNKIPQFEELVCRLWYERRSNSK